MSVRFSNKCIFFMGTTEKMIRDAMTAEGNKGKYLIIEGYSHIKEGVQPGYDFVVREPRKPWRSAVDVFIPTNKFGETKYQNMFEGLVAMYKDACAHHIEIERQRALLEEPSAFAKFLNATKKVFGYDLAKPFKKSA